MFQQFSDKFLLRLYGRLNLRHLPRIQSRHRNLRRFLLWQAGVAVVHGAAYGPHGEGTLRVSFAGGGKTLEQGLDRLRDGLLRLSADPREKGSG